MFRKAMYAASLLVLLFAAFEFRQRKDSSIAAAADIVFTVGSPETYSLLVDDRGWSPVRFERWYADTLAQLLLP